MSKADDDNLDPLDFDLPDEDLTASGEEPDAAGEDQLESLDEFAFSEEPGLDEAFGDLDEFGASDSEADQTGSKPAKKKKKKKEKQPKARRPKQESEKETGLVDRLVWAVCGVSCLGMLVADGVILVSRGASSIVFIILLTTIWLMATAIPFLLCRGRRTNTAYVVFLGVSLAGILLADLLLLMELAAYGGDIGAKGTQQSMHVAPAAQSAPDSASATA